jgi:UDP-N-acetylmuramoylalanine--D-glutamate ligase
MKRWLDFDRFGVFGMGRSGIAAANLLARRGKQVLASDTRSLDDMSDVAAQLDAGIELVGGSNAIGDAEVIVASPGLRPGLEVFEELSERDLPVISEIELAYEAAKAPILAITGTDGKSTTTVMTGHILEHAGIECAVGGNLGTPLCALVDEVSADGCIVAEVSAFQLWTTHHFSPRAFGLTNIAFDHLDYFDHYDEYVDAKRQVMKNAGAQTLGVFNLDDEHIRRWQDDFEGRVVGYALSREGVDGCDDALWFEDHRFEGHRLEDHRLSARFDGEETPGWIADTAALPITGSHNMLNLMCAAGLVRAMGVDLEQISEAMASFEPLPHRLEYVAEVGGVRFYDDSKATNVHAALAGLQSLEGELVAIVGGVDKGLDLSELLDFLNKRQARVVLIGEIRQRLESELLATGYPDDDIHPAETMSAAVDRAFEVAEPGGVVSLSPACSSFDMFKSYAHRGDQFQKLVGQLAD